MKAEEVNNLMKIVLGDLEKQNNSKFEKIYCPLCNKEAYLLSNDVHECELRIYCPKEGMLLKIAITSEIEITWGVWKLCH